jgi:lysophospholipase L1-like esterase
MKLLLTAFALFFALGARAAETLQLGDELYGVANREVNVYFAGLVQEPGTYYWTMSGSNGTHQAERWTWTPTTSATTTITFTAFDRTAFTASANATANLTVAAANAGGGASKKLLVIGDSRMAGGGPTARLLTLSAADSGGLTLTTVGTQGSGANKHEGRSGWSVAQFYTNAASPFVTGGVFDFAYYLSANSLSTPDHVIIWLGANDVGGIADDSAMTTLLATVVTQLQGMITSIHASSAAIKIGLALEIPGSSSQDAFGNNYGVSIRQWRWKRNQQLWIKQLITSFAGQTASKVYLVPSHLAVDPDCNMSVATVAARNIYSPYSINRQTNGVHIPAAGEYQVADAWWAYLKCRF